MTAAQNIRPADIAMSAALCLVAVLSGFDIASRPNTVEPDAAWQWGLLVVPPLLVSVWRLHPVAVTIAVTVAQALIWTSDLPEVLLPVIVILYGAAHSSPLGLRTGIAATIALTTITAAGVVVADDVSAFQLPLVALTCGIALWLGRQSAVRQAEAERLGGALVEQRVASERQRADAVTAERALIARELHDVIGHTLSMIAVRAEAAGRVADHEPDAPIAAVGVISQAARAGLDETRRVLAGLRSAEQLELEPLADLDAVRELVRSVADAGVDVRLREHGTESATLTPLVASGAYRIVQEALTNAIKHGGDDVAITVAIDCSPEMLRVRIKNSVSHIEHDSHPGATQAGSGLTGMTERAAVLGGSVRVNDGSPETFVVTAELPKPLAE